MRAIAGGLVVTGVVGSLTVNRKLLWLSGFVGGGLLFAGLTDTCMMANLLMRLPFNRANRADVSGTRSAGCCLTERATGRSGAR